MFNHEIISTEILFDFKRAEYDKINNYLPSVVRPDFENDFNNLNVGVWAAYSQENYVIKTFVPTINIKNQTYPRWFYNDLKIAINKKKEYHKFYKKI